jgi:bacteriorhodopsin
MDFTPFLVGFVIMSLSSVAIYAKGSKLPAIRHHTYMHAAVPFIAATAYLAMTFAIGDFVKPDGTVTLVARYVDWTFTTPILLSGLVLVAMHERRGSMGFVVSIVVLDVLMIVTGLMSSLAILPALKLVWFGWSCAAFLGVLYILWGPLRAISRGIGGPIDTAYAKNLSVLSIVWILYPVVFAIGPEGLRSVSDNATAWAILVLDVVAKVVYAFFAAANVEKAWHGASADAGYDADARDLRA